MLHKIEVKRIREDYYSYTEYEFYNGRWEMTGGYGDPNIWDLPEYIQKRHPRKSIRKDGQSYTFYAVECTFPHPAHIGKGWVNSQGEELPDRNHTFYAEL